MCCAPHSHCARQNSRAPIRAGWIGRWLHGGGGQNAHCDGFWNKVYGQNNPGGTDRFKAATGAATPPAVSPHCCCAALKGTAGSTTPRCQDPHGRNPHAALRNAIAAPHRSGSQRCLILRAPAGVCCVTSQPGEVLNDFTCLVGVPLSAQSGLDQVRSKRWRTCFRSHSVAPSTRSDPLQIVLKRACLYGRGACADCTLNIRGPCQEKSDRVADATWARSGKPRAAARR